MDPLGRKMESDRRHRSDPQMNLPDTWRLLIYPGSMLNEAITNANPLRKRDILGQGGCDRSMGGPEAIYYGQKRDAGNGPRLKKAAEQR
jgi:hypothetical protein